MGTRAHTVPRFFLNGFVAKQSAPDRDPFVWMGILSTGEIKRRSPKNVSISSGLYDGIGGFKEGDRTIEGHLSRVEGEAASAIRDLEKEPAGVVGNFPPAIYRFIAWQAARTPGWMETEQEWLHKGLVDEDAEVVEPPPPGWKNIENRVRTYCVEDPSNGQRIDVSAEELAIHRKKGWKWIWGTADRLEALHMQAWYLQVRHFARLSWSRLDVPPGQTFITSDRAVTWIVDGFIGTPPAALRDPNAMVVAALTSKTALLGCHERSALQISPREVNRLTACTASKWIAGSSREIIEQAIEDRRAALINS